MVDPFISKRGIFPFISKREIFNTGNIKKHQLAHCILSNEYFKSHCNLRRETFFYPYVYIICVSFSGHMGLLNPVLGRVMDVASFVALMNRLNQTKSAVLEPRVLSLFQNHRDS